MKLKQYQVDAFTDKVFSGNPAAVCPLDQWLDDEIMLNIAKENNLAETAFFVKNNGQYEIRWFTPVVEVDLCGHATLASAYVLFNYENHKENIIRFHSPRSGPLTVTRIGDRMTMNFPADEFNSVPLTGELMAPFNYKPVAAFRGKTDYMLVFEKEEEIRNMKPVLDKVAELDCRGVIVTAPGKQVDFVSRFFGPQSGIAEDPVTGSAHTTLTPYWSHELGKTELTAMQLSARQGYLECRFAGERVEISGKAKLFSSGEIYLD
jgi:PhzF family phenazine biosynthesis protein